MTALLWKAQRFRTNTALDFFFFCCTASVLDCLSDHTCRFFCCLLGFTLWRDTIAYGNSSPLTSLKELFFGKWWAVGNLVSLALEAANCSRVGSSHAIIHGDCQERWFSCSHSVWRTVLQSWHFEVKMSNLLVSWRLFKHCHAPGVEAPTSPACRKRHVPLYRSHRVMTSFIQQGGYSSKLALVWCKNRFILTIPYCLE